MNYVLKNSSNSKCTLDYKTALKHLNECLHVDFWPLYCTINVQSNHKTEFLPFSYVSIVAESELIDPQPMLEPSYERAISIWSATCRYGLNFEWMICMMHGMHALYFLSVYFSFLIHIRIIKGSFWTFIYVLCTLYTYHQRNAMHRHIA